MGEPRGVLAARRSLVLLLLLLLTAATAGCRDATLTFLSGDVPTVVIDVPAEGASAFPGAELEIEVTARDPGSGVAEIRVIVSGGALAEVRELVSPPAAEVTRTLRVTLPADLRVGQGVVLTAVARNADAERPRQGVSEPVVLAVGDNVAPTVRIRSIYPPVPSAGYDPGDVILVDVAAEDENSAVGRLEIAVEGDVVDAQDAELTPAQNPAGHLFSVQIPYNLRSGSARLTAAAVDSSPLANRATTPPITLVIGDGRADETGPTVWFSDPDPASSPTVAPGAELTVTMEASDAANLVDTIGLDAEGATPAAQDEDLFPDLVTVTRLWTVDVPAYPAVRDGDLVTLTGRATDSSAQHNPGSSPPLQVRVVDASPPLVTLQAPAAPRDVDPGEQVAVEVYARDVDGQVDALGFETVGALETSGSFDLDPDAETGTHTFTFDVPTQSACGGQIEVTGTARDDAAAPNTGSDGPVVLTVRDRVLPAVTIVEPQPRNTIPGENVTVRVEASDANCLVDRIAVSATGAVVDDQDVDVAPDAATATRSFQVRVPLTARDDEVLTLVGRATDGGGLEGASAPVELDVRDFVPPLLLLLSITDQDGHDLPRDYGNRVRPGATVTVEVSSVDPNSGTDTLDLAVSGDVTVADQASFGGQSTVVHEFDFLVPLDTPEGGQVHILVTSTDASRQANDATVDATLTVHEETAPSVQILAPAAGSEVAMGASVDVEVQASDTNPGVTRIDFAASGGATASDSSTFPTPQASATRTYSFSVPQRTARGTEIHLDATARDGADPYNEGAAPRVTVVVRNEPPSLTGAEVEPVAIYTDTVVSCVAEGYDDPNDDPAGTFGYRWLVDDVEVAGQTAETLDGAVHFDKGDEVACEVTPNDGAADGPPELAAARTVRNSPPSLTGARVSPDTPTTDDDLECTPQNYADPDGDPAGTPAYRWFVGSSPIGSQTSRTLPAAVTGRGDRISCEVTPSDGTDDGAPVQSDPVTVGNLPPSFTGATVTPADPQTGDTLTCTGEGYDDPDGDAPRAHAYRWFRGGTEITGQTGATLPAGQTTKGDSIRCEATPYDGTDYGSPVTSSAVTVGNSPPTASGATLAAAPDPPREGSTLTCAGQGWSDADAGDSEGWRYAWYIVGTGAIGGQTGATLADTSFAKGDEVYCEAIPWDGTDEGTARESNHLTIQNTPPTSTGATMSVTAGSGPPPREDSTLTCAGSDYADADGDGEGWHYRWYVGGSDSGQTGSTLTGAHFDKGQEIYCQAIPWDGTDEGTAQDSNAMTAVNTPPSITGASTAVVAPESPNAPTVEDTLRCSCAGLTDPDPADAEFCAWEWFQVGVGPAVATTRDLDLSGFTKGDQLSCRATPDDGTVTGSSEDSAPVDTINNAYPTYGNVALTPAEPLDGDDLLCTPSSWSDPDAPGDTEQAAAYEWWADDGGGGGFVQLGGETGATLAAAATTPGTEYRCCAQAYDGTDYGDCQDSAADALVAHGRWTELTPDPASDVPEAAAYRSAVFDAQAIDANTVGRLVLFGGYGTSATPLDTLHDLTLPDAGHPTNTHGEWTDQTPGAPPLPVGRGNHTLVSDGADEGVLFGGCVAEAVPPPLCSVRNDVWTLDLSTRGMGWNEETPGGVAPAARQRHAAAHDGGQTLYVHGGDNDPLEFNDDGTLLVDLAELDLSGPDWQVVTENGTPPSARNRHAMVHDGGGPRLVVFGGYDGSALNDVHAFDTSTSTWSSPAITGGPPPARYAATTTLGDEPTTGVTGLIVFGGRTGSGRLDDLWVLDLATDTWTELVAHGGPPAARHSAALIVDPDNGRLILVGGATGQHTGWRNDVWQFSATHDPGDPP